MATTAIGALSDFLREELPRVIHESLPAVAPIYNHIKTTYGGVKRDEIGRDWKVIHIFGTGLAGLMESAAPTGPALISQGTDSVQLVNWVNTYGTSVTTPFPSPLQAPHTGSLKRELSLHMMTGNFNVPITWIQGDALTASQIKQVARDVKAVGDMRALTEATSLFSAAIVDAADNTKKMDVLGRISAVAEWGGRRLR
jgi:hypothetical protein